MKLSELQKEEAKAELKHYIKRRGGFKPDLSGEQLARACELMCELDMTRPRL